jgi:hypothetical protein
MKKKYDGYLKHLTDEQLRDHHERMLKICHSGADVGGADMLANWVADYGAELARRMGVAREPRCTHTELYSDSMERVFRCCSCKKVMWAWGDGHQDPVPAKPGLFYQYPE